MAHIDQILFFFFNQHWSNLVTISNHLPTFINQLWSYIHC